jgi:hypothetical protein
MREEFLPQRRKGAKEDAKKILPGPSLCVFLCAFAPLREKFFLYARAD